MFKSDIIDKIFLAFFILLSAFILVLSSFYNYLLFHTISEMFSIVVAFGIFTLIWSSRKRVDNPYILIVGISYLFIGALDLLHTISYKGMNIFTDYDFYANQLWIATRYIESISISFVFLSTFKVKLRAELIFLIYFLVTTFVILSIFLWKNFPVCFIKNEGQTPFKIYSEYIVIGILSVSALMFIIFRENFNKKILVFFLLSIAFTIVSELFFTLYISNYSIVNKLGHIFKVASFYFIYRSVIITGVNEPANVIYMSLQKERTKLKKALDALKNSNTELIQYSSVVAHDLKNPLIAINSGIHLLEKKCGELGEEQKEILIETKKRTKRMLKMVDELLSYSKLNNNYRVLEVFDCNKIVCDAVDNLKVRVANTESEIIYENLPKIKCDEIQFISLFQNLIENAMKYRKKDVRPIIHITAEEKKDHFIFSVADNGIGIEPENKNKIFQIFHRVNYDDNEYPGSGIGLAFCKKIVMRHGGDIWVKSELGKGSKFYFTVMKSLS